MKIINVIPISKDFFQENLSYFTSKDVKPGALVTVPMRSKTVPAIVSSVEEIKHVKSALKQSQFKLKPIKSIKAPDFLRPEFIKACKDIAKYFVSPLGPVIKDLVPQIILEGNMDFIHSSVKNKPAETNNRHQIILIQAPKKERFQYYKSIIREEFAKDHSVFLCLPTTNEVDEFAKEFQKGIEKYCITMHGKMPRKKIKELWNKAIEEKHPILIIATKSFLSMPRADIGVIIVDCEDSSFYKLQKRPYLDIRKAAEIISKEMKIRLIFGDSLIRSETFYKNESGATVPPSRILSEAEQIIVDMSKKKETGWQKARIFSAVSEDLQKILREAYENNEKVILFINRRGYSTTTICNDCLRTILCSNCDTPLVLHKKDSYTSFVCHKCLAETKAPEQCPYCKSWRLEMFGIGIQKITDEIAKLFPKFKLFRMDSDTIKNTKQGRETTNEFLSTPGAILIGTEIIFSHIPQLMEQPAERVAVISVDALFTLPDFRINEKIFHLLLKLRSLAKKTFVIQSRLKEQNLFNDVIRGNISGFYKNEIENRQQFQYPPFKLLIKITREGKNKTQIKKEIADLEKKLLEWSPINYPAFIPKIKNIHTHHILLKINPQNWPAKEDKLHQILSSLPQIWKINIEPESLL